MKRAGSVRVDLLLTDVVMPGGMNGFALVREARSGLGEEPRPAFRRPSVDLEVDLLRVHPRFQEIGRHP